MDPKTIDVLAVRVATVSGIAVLAGCASTPPPPVYDAASRCDVVAITTLLKKGANPRERNHGTGGTALHVAAAKCDNPGAIRALLQAGAYVNAINDTGVTPLHSALWEDANLDVVAALVTAGADVNARVPKTSLAGVQGWTSLHLAARYHSDPAVITMLAEKGANPRAVVNNSGGSWEHFNGWTVLDAAVENSSDNKDRILKLLAERGAVRRAELQQANESAGFNWGRAAAIAGVAALGVKAADAGVPVEDVVEVAGAAIADIAGDTGGENLARVSGNQPSAGRGAGLSSGEGRSGTAQELLGLGSAMSGDCEIPGFAEEDLSAFDADNTGLSWCPVDVDLQWRSQALNAELSRCMFTLGRVTMATIASHRANIQDSCKILEGLGTDGCQCPSSYYELGRD